MIIQQILKESKYVTNHSTVRHSGGHQFHFASPSMRLQLENTVQLPIELIPKRFFLF